jgi:hypothetical protein
MLHPLAEAREMTAGGALPSGSLLEWIDDMYEGPKTMLDRTFGKWRNIRRAKHVFSSNEQEKMIFKVFGIREGVPTKHGQFNDTEKYYWLPEFWGSCVNGKKETVCGEPQIEDK